MDLLIENALIVDGTATAAFDGWISVAADRIGGLGRGTAPDADGAAGTRRIDARGRVVSPGFIDVHNHSDLSAFVTPGMDSYLRQGVTTLVVGNCGASAWPAAGAAECAELCGVKPEDLDLGWRSAADFLERIDGAFPAINVATLIGHGAIRMQAMGKDQARAPSAEEMTTMQLLLQEGLAAGAAGLSTGLVYPPGFHSTTDEIAELASVLEKGRLYASHIRAEGELLFKAIDEALEIGRRARVPVHISHLKMETDLVWGGAAGLLTHLDEARARGADVTADQYPYTAYETTLSSFLPPWAPVEELATIVADPAARDRLVASVADGESGWQSSLRGVGWERIIVTTHTNDGHSGRNLAEIADDLGIDPFDAAFSLLIEDPATGVIGHAMLEEDVRTILAREDVMVASDGTATSPAAPLSRYKVHPRYYGTFPRVLGRYVRDEGILSLEAAVGKMTALPADRFGFEDRGRIKSGAIADLVLFDPKTVLDESTYIDPHRFPSGIETVIVGGKIAWNGEAGERVGRALRVP